MNSEIKFRGKRLDNGEWVVGYLCENINGYLSIQQIVRKVEEGFAVPHKIYEIAPKTVGQFIGLKDKDGREIYEGDIVTAWSVGSCMTGVIKKRIDGLWIISPAYLHRRFWNMAPNISGVDDSVEIIGNIHDDPELLNNE